MIPLRSRIRGAFMGCLLGDTFGRVLEGAVASDLRASDTIERRVAHHAAWAYSDDTEMMLAVAESLLARGRVDQEHLLRTMAVRCEPSRGYGHGTRRVFEALAAGVRWRKAATVVWPDGSYGNGAAVRVVPIACLYHRDPDALAFASQSSAVTTHAHPAARVGCLVHAQAVARVLACERPEAFDGVMFVRALRLALPPEAHGFDSKLADAEALLRRGAATEEAARVLGNDRGALESVPLALFGFAQWGPRFEDVVTNLARAGGDVDTICAMGGALAGALVGEAGLPAAWIARVENGSRGREYVARLASEIAACCD